MKKYAEFKGEFVNSYNVMKSIVDAKTNKCALLADGQDQFAGCAAVVLAVLVGLHRALLRASAYGNMSIMFPMITSLRELQDA